MTEKIYTIEEIKNIISPLASEYGVDRVFLFGSYARGEATKDSDIDFRIDKGNIKGLRFCAFYNALLDLLNKPVDLVSSNGLDEDFLSEIDKEEILLYGN